MSQQDIRWLQRFSNYKKAFARLSALVELAAEQELDDVQQEALIQRFEYTQELSWKTIKDFYQEQGEFNIQGSRDAFQLAFKNGLIQSGQTFLETIKSRNEATHTYNEEIAEKVYRQIVDKYYDAFNELYLALQAEQKRRDLD